MYSIAFALALVFAAISIGCGQTYTQTVQQERSNRDRGYLGVQIQDVTKRLQEREDLTADHGAYVSDVVEDSPADKAGIREGDVILKFDEQIIDNSDDLTRAVRRTKPKTDVKIEIARKAERKTITATIGRLQEPRVFSFPLNRIPRIRIPRSFSFRMYTSHELCGMHVQDLNRQLGEYFEAPSNRGVLVTDVEDGSEAAKAGFKAGDVITKVQNHSIHTIDDLDEEISDADTNYTKVEVIRRGKPLTLTLHTEEQENENDQEDLFNFYVPDHRPHMESFRFYFPKNFHRDMERLKEELKDLHGNLKYEMKQLRRTLQSAVREL
jgi:S1-C subfamily serine protease